MLFSAIILYAFCIYVNYIDIKIFNYGIKLIEPLISLLEVTVIYYLCTKMVDYKRINLNNKMYRLLEDNSFGIYLFHQQIIYFMILLLNGIVHPIVQVLLSFATSLTISLLISMLLKKNKVLKFIFGL